MITCELKDRILNTLIDECPDMQGAFEWDELAQMTQSSPAFVNSVIEQFEQMGLISFNGFIGGGGIVGVNVAAHDFRRRGGFVGQEELLQKNIEKLLLEIDKLKPSLSDKVTTLATITSIAANITTALNLFISPNH